MALKPLYNLAVEFGPICVFLFTYGISDFYTAVAACIGATTVAVLLAAIRDRRVALFPIIGLASVLIFGLSSIADRNPDLFIIRDTVADLFFSVLLFGSIALGKPILKTMFEATFAITDKAWRILTIRWAAFYLILGIVNELVRRMATDDTWVDYKCGAVVLTILFGTYQFTLASRNRIPGESDWLGLRISDAKTEIPVEPQASGV